MLGETPSKQSLNTTIALNARSVSANIVASDLERLVLEKQFNEERLLRQLAYKDQALHLIQSQKNLKMDQYQLLVDEEMLRLKRKYQLEIDGLNIRNLEIDRELRNSLTRQGELVIKLDALSLELDNISKELIRQREQSKSLLGQNNGLRQAIKLSDLENQQLKKRNKDMQQEILILLQIQSDKSRQIALLQQNDRVLQNRILSLQLSLSEIQNHFKLVSENLRLKDIQCSELKLIIDKMDAQIQSKQIAIHKLTIQLEELVRVHRIKDVEISDLMRQNERLYNEISILKHQLHQLAITYNFVV